MFIFRMSHIQIYGLNSCNYKMHNFNQNSDDHVPDFLSHSVNRNNKLKIANVVLSQKFSIKPLIDKKRSLPNFIHQSIIQDKSIKFKYKVSDQMFIDVLSKSKQIQHQHNQGKQDENKIVDTLRSSKSEQKLPGLRKLNVQLNTNELFPQRFIRINRQGIKLKNFKNYDYLKYLNQKKGQAIPTNKQQQTYAQSQQPKEAQIGDNRKQKYFYIKNISLQSTNWIQQDNKQKQNVNMFVNKIKETQRRGRMSMNLLERKIMKNPNQLVTLKMKYQQMPKINLKEQIMKKFTQKLTSKRKMIQKDNRQDNEQNNINGWDQRQQKFSIEQFM